MEITAVYSVFMATAADIPRPAGCGISPLKFEMAH